MPIREPKQRELFHRVRFRPGRLVFTRDFKEDVFRYKLRTRYDVFVEANVILKNDSPLLYNIRIKPGFELLERNGLAKRLLIKVIDDLKSKGYKDLTLVVDNGQGAFGDYDPRKELRLIRYYSGFGFKVVGKKNGLSVMRLDFTYS